MRRACFAMLTFIACNTCLAKTYRCIVDGKPVYQATQCAEETGQTELKINEHREDEQYQIKPSDISTDEFGYDDIDRQIDELEVKMATLRATGDKEAIAKGEILRAKELAILHRMKALKRKEMFHKNNADRIDRERADHKRRINNLINELTPR